MTWWKCIGGRENSPSSSVCLSSLQKEYYLLAVFACAFLYWFHRSQFKPKQNDFETLMRGYLFTVEPKEAEEYFKVIGTKEEESYQFKKGASFLRKKLYTDATSQKHRNLYKMLCISAHPGIKGAARDYPAYLSNRIEDNFKMILCLIYGNIQMMAECFTDFLDTKTRTVIKGSMENIASNLGSIPLFEPDKEPYSSRIKLGRGNFLKVLWLDKLIHTQNLGFHCSNIVNL